MAKRGGAMAALVTVVACSLALLALADVEKLREDTSSSSSGKDSKTYIHTWPAMVFGWRIVVGTVIAFCGAALGSGGGVGGGGIFLPVLSLIIGFDTKSAAAVSKCMIVGSAVAAFYYNIRQRHPILDMPVIDYDLALLFQPVLVLGISIGVSLNVIFAEWMVMFMLIILCLVTSTMAFLKGVKKWKIETVQKEDDRRLRTELDTIESQNKPLPNNGSSKREKVSIIHNVNWKKLGIILCVWIAILALQILKSYTSNCSTMYWVFNLLQIPVVISASGYEAVMLYKGKSVILSRGDRGTNFKARQLVLYCIIGVVAGAIGGMVGFGGGFVMGPLLLEMGVPPQVSSATSMFAVLFSSSMSVVEYYILKRFPIPYTLYFVVVATTGALVGQYVIKKAIDNMGRASLIIFILAICFFISAFFIGGEGIVSTVQKIDHHKYMGFDSICSKH